MGKVIELEVKDGNKVNKKLMKICKYISKYYQEIKNELLQLSNSLEIARECIVSYEDKCIAKMNFEIYDKKLDIEYITTVITGLEQLDSEFSKEFMQGVDFLNLKEQIFNKNNKLQIIDFISETKKIMQYTLYQLDRIYKAKANTKKLAILKGMIAYS